MSLFIEHQNDTGHLSKIKILKRMKSILHLTNIPYDLVCLYIQQ